MPIAFLFLAWPVPYNLLVDNGLEKSTAGTLFALKAIINHWAVATPIPGSDGSLFLLGSGPDAFQVSVASACAGVNSVVGFLLVGLAFTTMVKGRKRNKLIWLLSGLVLIWLLNVARLLLIFWVGGQFGEGVAIDGLHPVIGLILFSMGMVIMLAMTSWFGLYIDLAPKVRDPARPPALTRWKRAMTSEVRGAEGLRAVSLVVVAATVVLTISNNGLSRYGLFADDLGSARLASFQDSVAEVPGYSGGAVANYPWTKRFFGSDSSWDRFLYQTNDGSSGPVVVDVVTTGSLRRLSAYDVEACYRFHGYEVKATESFALSGGIRGELVTYKSADQATDWNALYWIWPVQERDGGTHYERIVLLQSTDPTLGAAAPSTELSKSAPANQRAKDGRNTDDRSARALRAFANGLIDNRAAAQLDPASS